MQQLLLGFELFGMLLVTSVGRCFCWREEHVEMCLSCCHHFNLILQNFWGRSLNFIFFFQQKHLCTPVLCVHFSLDLNSLGLDIAHPASSTALAMCGNRHYLFSLGREPVSSPQSWNERGTCHLKRRKLEKPAVPSLSHSEKTSAAKNEESKYSASVICAGRLHCSQSWKQERRCYWDQQSVCWF